MALVIKGINSGEDLFRAVREKRQLIAHREEVGYPLPSFCDDGTGSAWKYRPLRGNYFTWEEVMGVDHRLLRISSKDSRFMAVTQVLCLEAVWKALEDAGLRAEDVYKTRTGIFVGACEYLEDHPEAPDDTNLRGILASSLADRIGFFLGTHGPSITMDTACSGSLTALSTAAAYLRKGDCDTALVVTVSVRYVHRHILALQAAGVLSESGYSHPFDDQAEGLGRGEGLGCVVLRRMADAERDTQHVVAALVNATAGAAGPVEEAKEGAGRNYEATCAAGIYRVMTICYEQARVPLEHVRYIEAHATGTRVGDIIEVQAIARAFRHNHDIRTNPLRVGSVKGNIGHAEAAAGLFSFIKALEMVRHRTFLPAGGLRKPRTDFDWRANNVTPCFEAESFPEDGPTYIGVNSFGLGGGYAHAILCPYTPSSSRRLTPRPQPLPYELVPLTAVSEDHLVAYEDQLANFLGTNPHVSLLDVAGTFAAHRSALRYRRSYIASSVQDLIHQLRGEGKPPAASVDGGPCLSNGVAMVFTGQGSQWLGCGDALLSLPVYRRTVTAIDSLFLQHAGWSLREKQASLTVEQLAETQYAQPVTFMVQVALFETLKSLGIAPALVMGHSAGEVPAAYASGLLTLDEAVGVVYHRSLEQQRLAGSGRMLAIGMDARAASDLLTAHASDLEGVELACINSPRSVVLAGPAAALARFTDLLPQGCFHALIPGNIAFHCKLTEPIVHSLMKRLAKVLPSASAWKTRHASVPLISTVTGKLHDGPLDAKYWVDNVRHAVRFQDAVETLCRLDPCPSLVLEIGPHRTLVGPLLQTARSCAPDLPLTALSTLKRQTDDVVALFTCLSQLMDQGYPVRLPRFYAQRGFIRLRGLPGHPFLRKPLRDYRTAEAPRLRTHYEDDVCGPCAGSKVLGGLLSPEADGGAVAGVTRGEVSEAACPLMAQHKVKGDAVLPPSYHLSCAIEASGGLPCVLSHVDFPAPHCAIPRGAEDPLVLSTCLAHADSPPTGGGDAFAFSVQSVPLARVVAPDVVDRPATVHCRGKVWRYDSKGAISTLPGGGGLRLADIGTQGLTQLCEQHSVLLVSSAEEATALLNLNPQLNEYGPAFHLLRDVRMSTDRRRVFARVSLPVPTPGESGPNGAHRRFFTPQLLEAITTQLWLLHPDRAPGVSLTNDGFDVGVFLRAPCGPCDVFVALQRRPDHDECSLGHTFTFDNVHLYDGEGRVLLALGGTRAQWGGDTATLSPCVMSWQPLHATLATPLPPAAAGPEGVAELVACVAQDKARRHRANLAQLLPSEAEDPGIVVVRVLDVLPTAAPADKACWSGTALLTRLASSLPLEAAQACVVEIFCAGPTEASVQEVALPNDSPAWLRLRRLVLPQALPDVRHFAWDVLVADQADDALLDMLRPQAGPGALLVLRSSSSIKKESRGEEEEAGITVERLEAAARPEGISDAYVIVGDESDATTCRAFARHLHAREGVLLCGKDQVLPDEPDSAAGAEVVDAWAHALNGRVSPGGAIVFLAGLADRTPLAARSFARLVTLCKALHAHQPTPAGPWQLWVVTRSCFSTVPSTQIGQEVSEDGAPVGIGQASLYAVTRHLEAELPGLFCVRYVDLGSTACLPQLAALLHARPCERNFVLPAHDPTHPLVQRYVAVGGQAKSHGPSLGLHHVSSSSSRLAYHAEVLPVEQGPPTGKVSLRFMAQPLPPLRDGEVTVQIKAVGLNLRDVLLAMGMMPLGSLSGSFYGKAMGIEACAIITALGPQVPGHLHVGDRVITTAGHSFASFQNVPHSCVYPLPSHMSFEMGAAVISTYTTAHYALVHLANVRKGQRVLIHCAAGGVGQAALALCQHLGAQAYATCSFEKRPLLAELGMSPDRIFDSRSSSWFDDLMAVTGQQGMHVVLNCLTGSHQQLGLQALAPNGRFIELGKMDVYRDTSVSQGTLRRNNGFFTVDMERLAQDDPILLREVTSEVLELLSSRAYRAPTPLTPFPMSRLSDAMDVLRTGRHTGKVVLLNETMEEGDTQPQYVTVPCHVSPLAMIRPNGLYLVTGGAGGFGSCIVRRLADLGATRIVVTVTTDPGRVTSHFADLLERGVCVDALTADLSKMGDVDRVLDFCRSQPQPLKGIFHCAGFTIDKALLDLSAADLRRIAGPKNAAAWRLHTATRDCDSLEVFALIGSTSADISNRNATVYAASNAMLNALVRHRRLQGLPAVALNMTSLTDVGIVARDWRVRMVQAQAGLEFVTSSAAVSQLLDAVTDARFGNVVQWQLQADCPFYGANTAALLHNLPHVLTLGAAAAGGSGAKGSEQQRLLANPSAILEFLVSTIGSVTKNPDVSPKAMLANLGLDSFSLLELTGRIKSTLGLSLPAAQLTSTTTVEQVVSILSAMLRAEAARAGAAAGADGKKEGVKRTGARQGPAASAEAIAIPLADLANVRSSFEEEEPSALEQGQESGGGEQWSPNTSASSLHSLQTDSVTSKDSLKCLPVMSTFRPATPVTLRAQRSENIKAKIARPTSMPASMSLHEAQGLLTTLHTKPDASKRLIVFPPAGAGPDLFGVLSVECAEVIGVLVPGRPGSSDPKPIRNLEALGLKIATAIERIGLLEGRPLSLLGHSAGAALAFEVTMNLKRHYGYTPEALFIVGLGPPQNIWPVGPVCWQYNTGVFLYIAGATKGLLRRDEAEQTACIVRDIRDSSAWAWRQMQRTRLHGERLDCPILVCDGDKDWVTSVYPIRTGWARYTTAEHTYHQFPGKHYFLFQLSTLPPFCRFLDEKMGGQSGDAIQHSQ